MTKLQPVATIHFQSTKSDPLKVPRPLQVLKEEDGTLRVWGGETSIPHDQSIYLAGFSGINTLEFLQHLPDTVLKEPTLLVGKYVELMKVKDSVDTGFTLPGLLIEKVEKV